ncbi:alpha/beta hydrolase [Corynebacterium breve]|uniref:Alpha/beta hydrolase n=1 Tax=Corynebacterium breve TaxID=3049799 RepID=A0ABY8VI68_9CORY|nr:alpha/beta hydrolase [Corynebacterium breve]WIM67938.1 alpha/beta hydrolase [Corynebacterium breve]
MAKRYATSPNVVELDGDFTHHMLHTRGIRLHAATAGDPANPLILLLHGTFGAWLDFKDVIAPLADEGFHVAALDMRGYGMSDKPPAVPGDEMRIAAGDVAGSIAALGHKAAVLVGHDTGGSVAWACAAQYPERVTALVSASAAHPSDLRRAITARPWNFIPMLTRIAVGKLPSGLLTRLTRLRAPVWRYEMLLNTTPSFQSTQRFGEFLQLRITAAGIGNAMPHIVHNSRLLTPKLRIPLSASARVSAPTLLVHPPQGLWDHVAARSRARVDAPVEEVSIPGSKNLPHIEQPTRFVRFVANYAHSLASK